MCCGLIPKAWELVLREKKEYLNKERRRTAETESKMLNLGRFCIASNVLVYGLGSSAWSQTGRCGE